MGMMHFDYLSTVLGYHTSIYYILPACTHEGKEPKATLYLLHGGAGNGLDWIRYTSIERYADECEVAVVMPEVDGSCFYTDMKFGYNYFTFLKDEVIAVTETLLPVNKTADKRLVAGLSMGGFGAYKWAFNCPDMFAAAANLSGFSSIVDLFGDPNSMAYQGKDDPCSIISLDFGSLEELEGSIDDSKLWVDKAAENGTKLPKLFAGIGTEDFTYQFGKDYIEYMKSKGIDVHYEEMPGAHEWKVWDEMIQRFLKWSLA